MGPGGRDRCPCHPAPRLRGVQQSGFFASAGSRYVRPPIIFADVVRPAAMTVREFELAQSLTAKPVKGMLTGPVTMLNWAFPRVDITRAAIAQQLARAVRAEVADLEAAGCKVVQARASSDVLAC